MSFFKHLHRLLPLLLLAGLSSCSVYDHIFHPHRLGSPTMTAQAKAKAKASYKAHHQDQSTTLKPADGTPAAGAAPAAGAPGSVPGAADPTAAVAAAPVDDAKALSDKNKAIEDMLNNTYNTKTGLLKRTRWQRMQANSHKLHHYDTRPLTPRDASKDARSIRKHPKGKGKETSPKGQDKPMTDEDLAPAGGPPPTPDPTQPANPKAAKTAKPGRTAAPRTAAPKAPAPKNAKPTAPRLTAPKPAKPTPTPKKPKERPSEGQAPRPATEPTREEAPVETEKPRKEKKAKKDKKAPVFKADPTQPPPGE